MPEGTRAPPYVLLASLLGVLLLGAPSLWGDGVDVPDDALYYSVAGWDWLRTAVAEGRSLWFVPGKLGGVSLFADVLPLGPFYPACWLLLPLPTVPALGVAGLLHAALSLLAVRWCARVFGAGDLAATLAAAGFVLGPLGTAAFVDMQVDAWPAFLFLPLAMGLLERGAEALHAGDSRPRQRALALAALCMGAAFLGSHLRVAAATGAALGLWILLRGRDLRGGLLALLAGAALGAPGYVPMLLEARAAAEGGTGATGAGLVDLSLPWDLSLGLHALGGWLAPTVLVQDRDVSLGSALALGLLAGIFAPGAGAGRGGSEPSGGGPAALRRARRLLLFAAILILAGARIPFGTWIFAPLLVLTHPVDVVYPVLATLPLALLAARGIERLLEADRPLLSAWLRGPAGIVLGAAALLLLLRAGLGPPQFRSPLAYRLHLASIGQGLVFAGGAWLVLRSAASPARRAAWLCAWVLLDLAIFDVRAHVAIPSRPLVSARDQFGGDADELAGGFLDLVDLAAGFDSALPGAEPPEAEPGEPDASAASGEPDSEAAAAEGGTDTPSRRRRPAEDEMRMPERDAPRLQADLLDRALPPHLAVALGVPGLSGRSKLTPARAAAALAPLAERLHDTRAAEFVLPELFRTPGGLGARTLALHGIPLAIWGDVARFRMSDVAPPCRHAHSYSIEADDRMRLRAALSRPSAEAGPALLEDAPPELPSSAPAQVRCPDGVGPGVHFEVDAPGPGSALVVLRQRWHPGWRVQNAGAAPERAGRSLGTFPVNQVQLGVLLPEGSHRLRLDFVPPGLRGSLALAATALLLLLIPLLPLQRFRRSATRVLPLVLFAATARPGGAAAAPPSAAEVRGHVEGWTDRASFEVWLVDDLDLSRAGTPVARAAVEPESARFVLPLPPAARGPLWVFLVQRVPAAGGGPPLPFYRPYDLEPLDLAQVPADLRLRAVPPFLARLRDSGRPWPGFWMVPLALGAAFYAGAALLRWLIYRRLALLSGLRALRDSGLIGRRPRAAEAPAQLVGAGAGTAGAVDPARNPGAASASAPASAPAPAIALPPSPRERLAVAGILLAALALRLRRFVSQPLDLEEHTYGPGSDPIIPSDSSTESTGYALSDFAASLLHPGSLEVTHPPLYHALLGLLLRLSPAEWLLRLPSLLASLAAIVLLWALLRPLSRPAALAAAAALAVSAPAVFFGQDATPYALLSALALGSLLALLRALDGSRPGPYRLWLLLLAAGFLCHYAVALFGAAQLASVASWSVLRRRSVPWLHATHRALGAMMLVAPLPLLWSLLHFAWFPMNALDTRLFADVYPADPGALPFFLDFAAVTAGLPHGDRVATAAVAVLASLGLVAAWRRDRRLGGLLIGMAAAYLSATFFFHGNLVRYLHGRVFWGFRWVSWAQPFVLGLAALGALLPVAAVSGAGRAPRLRRAWTAARFALALVWLLRALPFALSADAVGPRPDYRGAARVIASEFADRDALAVLPLWGQRGPVASYLMRELPGEFKELRGVLVWTSGGRAGFLEAMHEGLPLPSSARNAHVERLWVAVARERVFGRDKFRPQPAERAISALAEALEPDGRWELDGVTLHRFRRRAGDLALLPGQSLALTAPEAEAPDGLRSLPYQQPNQPGCVDGEEPGDARRWELHLRVPVPAPGPAPSVTVERGDWEPLPDVPGFWAGAVLGGPCDAAPPRVVLTRAPP